MLEKAWRWVTVPVHVTVFQLWQGVVFPLVVLGPRGIYLVLLLFLLLFLFKRFKKSNVIFINYEGKVSEGKKKNNQQRSLRSRGGRSSYLILTDKMTSEMPTMSVIHHLLSKRKLHTALESSPILTNFSLIVRLPSLDFLPPPDWNL